MDNNKTFHHQRERRVEQERKKEGKVEREREGLHTVFRDCTVPLSGLECR